MICVLAELERSLVSELRRRGHAKPFRRSDRILDLNSMPGPRGSLDQAQCRIVEGRKHYGVTMDLFWAIFKGNVDINLFFAEPPRRRPHRSGGN